MRQEITRGVAQGEGKIQDFINWLEKAKEKGASNYRYKLTQDRGEDYHDIILEKELTPEELKAQEIEKLEARLKLLKK
jgi:hypothetical protein